MDDDFIILPVTVLVLLVSILIFFVGWNCGQGEVEKNAVANNVGEWYVNSTGNKIFHFYIEPKK